MIKHNLTLPSKYFIKINNKQKGNVRKIILHQENEKDKIYKLWKKIKKILWKILKYFSKNIRKVCEIAFINNLNLFLSKILWLGTKRFSIHHFLHNI